MAKKKPKYTVTVFYNRWLIRPGGESYIAQYDALGKFDSLPSVEAFVDHILAHGIRVRVDQAQSSAPDPKALLPSWVYIPPARFIEIHVAELA